jgi:hypothetical protein
MALKMVRYREAVTFPIPVTWAEEDEPGVQGIFYEPRDDSGTLRVSVMQWKGKDEEDRNRILKSAMLPGTVETMKQGIYLKKQVSPAEENGEALHLHRWLVALALPDNVCRIIVFTHALTEAQEGSAESAAELETVDFAVRNAVFSYEPAIPLVDTP